MHSHKFTPSSIKLNFYSPQDIRSFSSCEITIPTSFDVYGYPVRDGLYDLRMGPLDLGQCCETCGLGQTTCPGHFGHIELSRPVLNPLQFDTLYGILKSSCFFCKCLKLTNEERKKFIHDIQNDNSNQDNFKIVSNLFKKCATKLKCPLCKQKSKKISKGGFCRILLTEDKITELLNGAYLKELSNQIFQNEYEILNISFFRGENNLGNFNKISKMFFIETLPVSPNKFRPARHMDGSVFENALNNTFSRIIQFSTLTETEPRYFGDLQQFICSYFDSAKSQGHKQILEKKEGLFRKNIMGKRVNFSARSVISPDPNLHTREIGVPMVFAKALTFPEKVTLKNHNLMKSAILNGNDKYPGANYLEIENPDNNNTLINLKFLSDSKRQFYAYNLNNIIVHRHLKDGDFVLVNRQPTLHSVSLMGHTVKVLKNENTLRMHYVNCKPYNADFDGDEMNIHFPQNYNASAEISNLSLNDFNYFVPSTGDPIRGLAQDHIVAASNLTMKDSFYTKEEYHSLVHYGLSLYFTGKNNHIYRFVNPCISSPVQLYSGKQIATTILLNLKLKISMEVKSKVSFKSIDGIISDDNITKFYKGIMIFGLLDKATLGTSSFSLIHACGEIYGYSICNDLLTIFGRIVNGYLFLRGFTIRYDDLLMSRDSERERSRIFREGMKRAVDYQKEKGYGNTSGFNWLDDSFLSQLDASMRGFMNSITSEAVGLLQHGCFKYFPENNMANTIMSGAKGSMVNLSQISLCLGQQELEGRRVPFMISGKTMPCFKKLDPSPSAGGYIFERFLSGINPATFYFHCMAGREGLIDTAVKTANSGYLQRCLVKHMEGITVEYDHTVRVDNKIIQFTYGDDGIDCVKDKYLRNIGFFLENLENVLQSEFDENLNYLIPENYIKLIEEKLSNDNFILKNTLKNRFVNSLVNPGHSVGVLAAQSIGEPSTQMTLNTFHLAGVGGKNVTLGIPRLREIVLVASKSIKTPMITIPILRNSDILESIFKKVTLDECLESVRVDEEIVKRNDEFKKHISITFKIRELQEECTKVIDDAFLPKINREIKRRTSEIGISEFRPSEIEDVKKNNPNDSSDKEEESVSEEEISDNDLSDEDVQELFEEIEEENLEQPEDIPIKLTNLRRVDSSTFAFDIYYSSDFNVLILPIIELISKKMVVREIEGYTKATVQDSMLVIEGSNFLELNSKIDKIDLLEHLDFNSSTSNDIYAIFTNFGVEAARATIVNEIAAVFDVYGININIRHLYLVADYMTKDGEFKSFSRGTFNMDNSYLQRMSFESCFSNLKNASLFHQNDRLQNPSACITVGNEIKTGTGKFELLYKIPLAE